MESNNSLRHVRSVLLCVTLAGSLTGVAAGCSESLGIQECTAELDGHCWTFLGLDSEWITEVAATPWGLFVGTNDHGIFRL